jgi:hypothetical membrane protein
MDKKSREENTTHSTRLSGLLLAAGAVQFLLGLVLAESLYPNYSVSNHFISDLGVGAAAWLFNGSVFLLGVMVIGAAYFLYRSFDEIGMAGAMAMAGIGAMGVGIFPETAGPIHVVVSFVTFFFGGVAALLTYRLKLGRVEALLCALLGLVSLTALGLFAARITLGLGVGGMERMIAYPILLWSVAAGGYFFGMKKKA